MRFCIKWASLLFLCDQFVLELDLSETNVALRFLELTSTDLETFCLQALNTSGLHIRRCLLQSLLNVSTAAARVRGQR